MKTGFIGLGKMGSVMAPRLADQATQLRGFDPNWHLPADSSVQPAPSIAALADCEIIFTMVPDGSVVVEIIEILLDAGTDALLVDMSSCHPDTSGSWHPCWQRQDSACWMPRYQAVWPKPARQS